MAATLEALHILSIPELSSTCAGASFRAISSPKDIAKAWLSEFEKSLASGYANAVAALIHQDGWWRDHLCLSWDFTTLRGVDKISDFLRDRVSKAGFTSLKLQESGKFSPHTETPIQDLEWVESMFSFKTSVGAGKGMIRLVQLTDRTWKAHMIYTALQELDCAKEVAGDLRPHGGNNSLNDGAVKGNWYERRQRTKEFVDSQPAILIIGAGQSGLNIGARLQALGLSCLLIDKNERVGDNWRHRYRTLVTHDPVQYTHMAYMPFPTNWPLFTPKDKLADWFKIYASAMELNIWLKSTVESAEFSDEDQSWTVKIIRGDGPSDCPRVVKPRHIVFCTGHAGEPKIPTFPGQEAFTGRVYHGSQHKDAAFSDSTVAGKKVVVVGTGNSGHDIAQNYYENGASVQMVQRRGTYVISAKTGLFMLHEGLYDEHGPPIEDADIFAQSLPIPVQFALNVALTDRIKDAEKETLEGLERANFKVDFGSDGSGIYRKYITRGGGYYIDVGASQLIVDGKIKVVQSPDGIQKFTTSAVVLADGRELEADVVVLATGFDNMRTTLRKALGDKVADRCRDVWGLDEGGEVNAVSAFPRD